MGQYYKPINTGTNEYLYSHDYGHGLKLMEHSWVGNTFVATVESLLAKGGRWHKANIVWAGDYADNEGGTDKNLYGLLEDNGVKITPDVPKAKFRYIINYSKRQYVDKENVPVSTADWLKGEPWKVHPLPLLTCEGNGRGGGDYGDHLPDQGSIGIWARDSISVAHKPPRKFTELKVGFRAL